MLENTEGTINNEQHRDTDNIVYTRHRTQQILEYTEGTIKNEQQRDTDNIGYTKHRTK